jgi:hypothetical protein
MSVSSLALNSDWRDYWGDWNALVEPWFAPLEKSMCHAPRFVILPELEQATFPTSGYIQYNFHLPPGSIIWGLYLTFDTTVSIQLTDVSLGHQFFQEPITADQVAPAQFFNFLDSFVLLPAPHQVVGDGLFSYEAWGVAGAFYPIMLGVAEVTSCPVR